MIQLHITVVDKVATYLKRGGRIVCGNSDYEVKFTFDKEWDAFPVKTARFIYNGQHTDVVFDGSTCKVPVLTGTTLCAVGVFAGDLCTTTPALIPCAKSILCEDGSPADPPEDVYNQIMALLNRGTDGEGRAYANALQGTASGEGAVVLDDVSPIAHAMGVKVASKNLYRNTATATTQTTDGLTFERLDDGGVKVSGTHTNTIKEASYNSMVWSDASFLRGKNIMLSSSASECIATIHIKKMDGSYKYNWLRQGQTTSAVCPDDAAQFNVGIVAPIGFSGETVIYPQIEISTVATAVTPYADIETVKIKTCGKNLVHYPYTDVSVDGGITLTTKVQNGTIVTINDDCSITVEGTPTAITSFRICDGIDARPLRGKPVVIPDTGDSVYWYIHLYYADGTSTSWRWLDNDPLSGTVPENALKLELGLIVETSFDGAPVNMWPQIEIGTVATEYERYVEPIEYTPNADGTVDGVMSLYPNVTLMSDTPGVVIDVEYNRDLNKAYAAQQAEIETLKQAVLNLI